MLNSSCTLLLFLNVCTHTRYDYTKTRLYLVDNFTRSCMRFFYSLSLIILYDLKVYHEPITWCRLYLFHMNIESDNIRFCFFKKIPYFYLRVEVFNLKFKYTKHLGAIHFIAFYKNCFLFLKYLFYETHQWYIM